MNAVNYDESNALPSVDIAFQFLPIFFFTRSIIYFPFIAWMKPGKNSRNNGKISVYIACIIPDAFLVGAMIALGRLF